MLKEPLMRLCTEPLLCPRAAAYVHSRLCTEATYVLSRRRRLGA
jgi:hypothetical protein